MERVNRWQIINVIRIKHNFMVAAKSQGNSFNQLLVFALYRSHVVFQFIVRLMAPKFRGKRGKFSGFPRVSAILSLTYDDLFDARDQ